MKIPICDLLRQTRAERAMLDSAIARVLDRGYYILGPEVAAFESEFASSMDVAECVTVASGTDALELALRATGAGPGTSVALVANAGGYGTTAVRATGARPVYVDVDPRTLNMSAASLAAVLRVESPVAVLVTHLYGRMADMTSITTLLDPTGIPLIEDCAQAHGARQLGRAAGTWGTLGCFSFYPTKNLGALGDGGAVVTADRRIADDLRLLRQYGWSSKYQSDRTGARNSRLDEIQAAVLRERLPGLPARNARRVEIASRYDTAFSGLLEVPGHSGEDAVAHLYVVQTPSRDQLRQALGAAGVGTDVHYPVPDHHQRSNRGTPGSEARLPVTELACRRVLTLPCFPEMTDAEVVHVIEAVRAGAAQGAAS